MLTSTKRTVRQARSLRRAMTLPEVLLWQVLRKRPEGLKFRRQHPSGPFVLDFYCERASLAIEVDGIAHGMGTNPERDAKRDLWFAKRGIITVRITATDVLKDIEAVVQHIVTQCQPLHHPALPDGPPPLQGGI